LPFTAVTGATAKLVIQNPPAVAAEINEGLRQQFIKTTIPETADALAVNAAQIKKATGEFVSAADAISNAYDGAAVDARRVIRELESTSSQAISGKVRESRADKLIEISTHELRAKQQTRLGPGDERVLTQIRADRHSFAQMMDWSAPSMEHAKDHIFERVSVAVDHTLLTEALRHGRRRIRLSQLKGELGVQESAGRILRSGREVATETSLERERTMIAAINRGVGGFEPLGAGRSFVTSDSLRPRQKKAVEFVFRSRDLAVSISGATGTGKTATLRELLRGLNEAARDVLAVAPTMSAVEELQKVGFADAITIERLLQDKR